MTRTKKPRASKPTKVEADILTQEGQRERLDGEIKELFGTGPTKAKPAGTQLGSFGAGDESRPHFLVDVPATKSGTVRFWEVRQTVTDDLVRLPRAELNRAQWDAIAPLMEREFNRELKEDGLPLGKFRKTGETRLALHSLGKEMMVFVWAVEELPETDLSTVHASWLNLHRVERWWLYNMTVAMNGHATQRGQGWRAALMHALSARPSVHTATDEGSNLQLKPLPRESASERKKLRSKGTLNPLFHKEKSA